MKTICDDFCFLYGSSLQNMSVADLKKLAADLAIKYSKDLKKYEFTYETESFKFQVTTLIQNIETASLLNILQALHDFGLIESYPNINVALRIFLTLPVSIASCEKSFSKLKLIKKLFKINYRTRTIIQSVYYFNRIQYR